MTRSRTWALVLIAGIVAVAAVVGALEDGPEASLEHRAEEAPEVRGDRGEGGVSAPTTTLLTGLLTGGLALIGVALGLFGDRHLRYRGDILCTSSQWSLVCYLPDQREPERSYPIPFVRDIFANERLMARAQHAAYYCDIKLFNEMEVATGLRGVTVVFLDDSGEELIRSEPRTVDEKNFVVDPVVINLPARQWVYRSYHGTIAREEFEALAQSTRVELRAYLPRDKPFVRALHDGLWG